MPNNDNKNIKDSLNRLDNSRWKKLNSSESLSIINNKIPNLDNNFNLNKQNNSLKAQTKETTIKGLL